MTNVNSVASTEVATNNTISNTQNTTTMETMTANTELNEVSTSSSTKNKIIMKKIVNKPIEFSQAEKDYIKGGIYGIYTGPQPNEPRKGGKMYRLNVGIKSWFEVNFPEKMEFLENTDETITFRDVLSALLKRECVYEAASIDDSVIREYIFSELAYTLNVNYSDISDMCFGWYTSSDIKQAIRGLKLK